MIIQALTVLLGLGLAAVATILVCIAFVAFTNCV